jgi:hypothetical protein
MPAGPWNGSWNEIAAVGEAVGIQSYSKCGLSRLQMVQTGQSSGLRRRERRFDSCRGRPVMSQDILDGRTQ